MELCESFFEIIQMVTTYIFTKHCYDSNKPSQNID